MKKEKTMNKKLLVTLLIISGCVLSILIIYGGYNYFKNCRRDETSNNTINYNTTERNDNAASKEERKQQDKAASKEDTNKQQNINESGRSDTEEFPVVVSFTGDVYLSEKMVSEYKKNGAEGIADDTVIKTLSESAITMINHEYACTNGNYKVTYQRYNFKSSISNEYILKEIGVDIVGIANNHILDYDISGFNDTLLALDSLDIEHTGAGNNIEEAKKAVIKEVAGVKIAFIATSHFVPSVTWHASATNPGLFTCYENTENYEVLLDYITQLKTEKIADIVVIFPHFGVEKNNMFVKYQQELSHRWIDAGADIVIGSHAHVLQGIEVYNGKYIYYNQGNFWFGNYEKDTMIVQMLVDKEKNIKTRIIPCTTNNFYVNTVDGEKAKSIYDFLESISLNVTIDENGNVNKQ